MDYRLFFGEVSPAVYEGSSGPRRRGVGARPRLGSQGIAGHGRLRNSTRPLARTPPQPSKLYRHADQELAERHLALKAKEVFLKNLRPKQPRSSDLELGTTPVVPQIRKWLRGVDLFPSRSLIPCNLLILRWSGMPRKATKASCSFSLHSVLDIVMNRNGGEAPRSSVQRSRLLREKLL